MSPERAPEPAHPASTTESVTPAAAPADAPLTAADGSSALAATLRAAMLAAFLVLPVIGAARAIAADGLAPATAILTAAVLVAIYLAGSQRALRRGAAGRAARTDLLLPAGPWVIVLTLAWMAATLVSGSFVWIAFTLFFLVLFALGPVAGRLALLVVALWAVAAPLLAGAQSTLGIGEILGPLIGAVFSLIAHAVYRRLLHESDRNRELVAQLRAAQSELADSERRKGIAEERQRLAQDIHDTLAQGLNSIVMHSRAAGAAHPSAANEFAHIEDSARENLAEARRLVRDLADRAPRTGLEQALRGVLRSAQELGTGTAFDLRVDGAPYELPPEQVETLQRAAQSLVANVQRHAAAERCVLTLGWFPDRVSLDVVDDGRGFDPAAQHSGDEGGDGLRLLRARMDRAGGSVAIDSTPGEGTTVGLSLPARPAHPQEPAP